MSKKSSNGSVFVWGLAKGLGLGAYMRYVRPWMFRYGATDEEVSRRLPGDERVGAPFWGWTHAITIEAPARRVWPWLVQRGYGRGGWYTYDWLYQMLGAADFIDGHSADTIIPQLQDLQVGDDLPLAPGIGVPIVEMEENRYLLAHARGVPGAGPDAQFDPENFMDVSWLWYLEQAGPNTTRLIDRCRLDYSPSLATMLMQFLLVQPGGTLLDLKMLSGIKERAERV